MVSATQPNCLQCNHYFITHEPEKPYGCKAMAFKSRKRPSVVVFEVSGIPCQRFLPKKGSGKKTDPGWTA